MPWPPVSMKGVFPMNKDYIKPEVEFVNLTAEPITTEELLPNGIGIPGTPGYESSEF